MYLFIAFSPLILGKIRTIRGHLALLEGPFLKQFYPDTSGS